jgi:deoxyribonuclease V
LVKIQDLHAWQVSPGEAVNLQLRLADQVELIPFELLPGMRVAGVDVSYRRFSSLFHAAIAVLDYPSLTLCDQSVATLESPFPYVPGLLSFREMPVVIEAFRNLGTLPDLVMVDGQGLAHPRRFGLACHLGIWLATPTLGCAKSRLCGVQCEPGEQRGMMEALTDDGEEIGRVVRTRDGVKPLFVSPGHLCDIGSAAAAVLACHGGYRLPEPTRQAHLLANRQRLAAESYRSCNRKNG